MTRSLTMNPGDLRHSVTLLRQTTSVDLSGTVITWAPHITTRAAIEPIKGTDLVKAGQDISQVLVSVKMRYRPDVDASMRLQTPSGVFIVQSVENILERNRVLILTCLALKENA